MPKREDIKKILVVGAGPIVIGQGCEFDYSGTQACRVLKEEGYEIVLLNSNPATIMTDPVMADATYVEPITPDILEKIIIKEKPDAILPTLGGQTALNVTMAVAEQGILEKNNVEVIGANIDSINKAEDRELFRKAMTKIGLKHAKCGQAYTMEEARKVADEIGFPLIIRPSFTLGGTGGGVAYNQDEFEQICKRGLEASRISEIMIEESVLGWKEYEFEVMRDKKDNVVIVCTIENLDPMGIHTGDSITVAPIQTLSDPEFQMMRDAAIDCIREIGVETGGSNVQFAINPKNGDMIIIEMNPRVSRSSALASKATGFPIAKIAAKLAVGYTLDEIDNDITLKTPACFEPTIDYVVTKIPRFNFEKFNQANATLTTSMKSVGEAMSIGRTFKESLQKCLRSLETGLSGLEAIEGEVSQSKMEEKLRFPHVQRLMYVKRAFLDGMTLDEIYELSAIDPWFLYNIKEIVDMEKALTKTTLSDISKEELFEAKQYGFSDKQLAKIFAVSEIDVRAKRKEVGIKSVYKVVDTCAAEFEAYTPYYYSTYELNEE